MVYFTELTSVFSWKEVSLTQFYVRSQLLQLARFGSKVGEREQSLTHFLPMSDLFTPASGMQSTQVVTV